jgi:1-acyl-sn-glycerol-3-phosphate acyltransferase
MRRTLSRGFSILLYPEGTRNRKRSEMALKDFYDGAFKLASQTGFPLAVMTLNDSGKLNDPIREFDLSPGLVEVDWDLIMETKDVAVEDLREQTRTLMLSHLEG